MTTKLRGQKQKTKTWEELTVSEKFDILIDWVEDLAEMLEKLRDEIEDECL